MEVPVRLDQAVGVPLLLDARPAAGPADGAASCGLQVVDDVAPGERRRRSSDTGLAVPELGRDPDQVADRCGPHRAVELGHVSPS